MKIHQLCLKSAHLILICSLISLTGCEDGNLFGRLNDRGGSGDPASLNSDANIALRQRDYSAALALYERVLGQDPQNSIALYGASAAAIGSTGINFGTILSNISGQLSGSSVSDLGDLVAQSREVIHTSVGSDPNSLLNGVDLARLDTIIDLAICRLQKIITGAADGSIAKGDIDVLLNLGILCIIRGVLRPLRAGWLDIKNVNGDFDIEVDSGVATTFCTNAANSDVVKEIARDVVGAFALFNRAATVLNLSGSQIISRLRDDIQTATSKVLDPAGNVPAVCISLFSSIGITQANFTSNTDVFDVPPSSC